MSETKVTKFENAKLNFSVISITIFILAIILLVLVLGIYQFGWDNQAVAFVADLVPFPALIVEGKLIPLSTVFAREQSLKQVVTDQDLTDDNLRELVLTDLITEKAVEIEATKRGITVTPEHLGEFYNFLLSEWGLTEANAEEQIRDKFGLSLPEFERQIVRPDLLERELRVSVLSQLGDSESYQRILEALQELYDGQDFADVARFYSEDESSRYIAGELGILTYNEVNPWLRETAFALPVDEVSKIVVSPEGYHIIKVGLRDETVQGPKVLLQQIFVAENGEFDQYLSEKIDAYKVRTFKTL